MITNSKNSGNPFMEVENRMKDYIAQICDLREENEDQRKTISELRSEIYRLKKELESRSHQGDSVIINKSNPFAKDEVTEILKRDNYATQILDDQSTQILGKRFDDDLSKSEGTEIIKR